MNTLFFYDPIFLEHETGAHPERPERLTSITSYLEKKHGEDFDPRVPRSASREEIALIHDDRYIEAVEQMCNKGGGYLDGDTPVSPRSFDAALRAAGALLDGADALMKKKTHSAFALVRPPGHHARPAAGMGFCLFNNVAVAAAYLKERHGLERLLILDIDVHHGNGTQEAFYQDGAVYFLSFHRYPFYPGTGGMEEQGEGPGKGTTRNLPVPPGVPPEKIIEVFSSAVKEATKDHQPRLILVSAGFDAYAGDPIGGLGLEPEHYRKLGEVIRDAAKSSCEGRVLSTLEGGYSLSGLPCCLVEYVKGLEQV